MATPQVAQKRAFREISEEEECPCPRGISWWGSRSCTEDASEKEKVKEIFLDGVRVKAGDFVIISAGTGLDARFGIPERVHKTRDGKLAIDGWMDGIYLEDIEGLVATVVTANEARLVERDRRLTDIKQEMRDLEGGLRECEKRLRVAEKAVDDEKSAIVETENRKAQEKKKRIIAEFISENGLDPSLNSK